MYTTKYSKIHPRKRHRPPIPGAFLVLDPLNGLCWDAAQFLSPSKAVYPSVRRLTRPLLQVWVVALQGRAVFSLAPEEPQQFANLASAGEHQS